VRIAGLRIAAPAARLLVGILRDAGVHDTAARIEQAIELEVATEAPLTVEDHETILVVLGDNCPSGLSRLRRELLEEQRWLRRRPS
jgi:hypothetical protein